MYVLKHAFRNIARKPGGSILLFAIAAAVVAVCTAGAMIAAAANGTIAEYKKQFDAIVTISPDIDKLMAGQGVSASANPVVEVADFIQPGQYAAFAQSGFLKGSVIIATVPVTSPDIKAIGQDSQAIGGKVQEPNGNVFATPSPALTLVGDSDTENLAQFKSGQWKISQGRMYQDGNECIVSADLAALNGLSVGSPVSLGSAAGKGTYSLTVVGVYTVAPGSAAGAGASPYPGRNNEILTNFDTAAQDGSTGAEIEAVYYLKDPGMLGAFQNELRAKGLPNAYQAATDKADYDNAAEPLLGMRDIALAGSIAALALGAAAAALLSALSGRKRSSDTAALRAMGMKKRTLALALACEALIVAAAGVCIGLPAGALSAKPASALVLQSNAVAPKRVQMMNIASDSGVGKMLVREVGYAPGGGAAGVKPDTQFEAGRNPMGAWWAAALSALILAAAAGAVGVLRAARFDAMRAYRKNARGEGENDDPA